MNVFLSFVAALALGLLAPAARGAPRFGEVDVPAGKYGAFPAYLPDGATKEKPCPLVVACHGHGDTAKNFRSCLERLANESHVALLLPEGVESTGNGGFGWNNFPDRGKVIEAAIRSMLASQPLDPKRVLWLGHSAGTWVACQDGAKLADLCAGIVLTAAPTATLEGGAKGAKPKVALFLGTQDPNYASWPKHLAALKAAQVVYSANRVTDLAHEFPDDAYVEGAIAWLLEGRDTQPSENTLPKKPLAPDERACHHLLVRFKGAEGAGDDVKRSDKDAQKQAEHEAVQLRKEKLDQRVVHATKSSEAEKAKEENAALSTETAKRLGALMRFTCWTVGPQEVRLVRTALGWHAVWAEK